MKLWSVCAVRTSNPTTCSIIWPHSNWRWQNEQIDTRGEGVQVINNGYRCSLSAGVIGHRKVSHLKVYQPLKATKSLLVKIFKKKKRKKKSKISTLHNTCWFIEAIIDFFYKILFAESCNPDLSLTLPWLNLYFLPAPLTQTQHCVYTHPHTFLCHMSDLVTHTITRSWLQSMWFETDSRSRIDLKMYSP